MIDQVKKAFERLEKLSSKKQEEIAGLIQEELDWDSTFEQTQDQLSAMANEAIQEYDAGKTTDQDW
jgi:hypothetical protein